MAKKMRKFLVLCLAFDVHSDETVLDGSTSSTVAATENDTYTAVPVTTYNDNEYIIQTGGDELVTIFDEDVPLADVPQTGDISLLWMAMSGVSAGGLMLLNKKRRK